jgi:pimeloyl-ACP methyl ester carboxylesterase
MIFKTLSMLFLIFSSSGAFAAQLMDIDFQTSDQLKIHGTLYTKSFVNSSSTLLIMAPGFAETSERPIFQQMSEMIAESVDVLNYDVRGTGKSQGFYPFGSDDYLDIKAILDWAHPRYAKIDLLGFSLGAYSSMRAAIEYPSLVNQVLLVSCPQSLMDIITSGGVFDSTWQVAVNPAVQSQQHPADLFFRWGNPFGSEPNLVDVASRLEAPVAFLVGSSDPLIFPARTRMIYDGVESPKTWTEIQGGYHAEMMFHDFPTQFMQWVQKSLQSIE